MPNITLAAAPDPAPLAYDVATACRITSLGKTAIYEAMADGRLQSRKIGRRRVILADSLRALITEGC